MFDGVKHMAEAAGRDPSALQMVVRANLELAEHPLGSDRMIFTGRRRSPTRGPWGGVTSVAPSTPIALHYDLDSQGVSMLPPVPCRVLSQG